MNLRKERRNEEKPWKHAGTEESVIGEDGKVEPGKIQALIFDQFRNGYYVVGEKVGQGWNAGKELVKKAQGK